MNADINWFILGWAGGALCGMLYWKWQSDHYIRFLKLRIVELRALAEAEGRTIAELSLHRAKTKGESN